MAQVTSFSSQVPVRSRSKAERSLRVLVVEDDPDGVEELCDCIIDFPFQIDTASDGKAALAMVEATGLPDILLTDIRMPFIDGLTLAERILFHQGPDHQCAVLFISGHADTETVIHGLQLNAVDFLLKPLDRQRVRDAVERAGRRVLEAKAETARQLAVISELKAFKAQVDKLSRTLGAVPLAVSLQTDQTMHGATNALQECQKEDVFLILLRKLQRIRNARRALDDDEIAEESVLDILLDLMSAKLNGQSVTVTSLCAAAGVPQTTALRRIDALERASLISRVRDKADRRRVNVVLTETGEKRVADYLSDIAHLLG